MTKRQPRPDRRYRKLLPAVLTTAAIAAGALPAATEAAPGAELSLKPTSTGYALVQPVGPRRLLGGRRPRSRALPAARAADGRDPAALRRRQPFQIHASSSRSIAALWQHPPPACASR